MTRPRPSILGGVPWTTAGEAISGLSSLAAMTVAWRTIPPAEFGLVGFAMTSVHVVDAVTQPGFLQASIQRKDISARKLDIFWTLQLLRGALVALGLFVAAPWLSAFFEAPNAGSVLRALCAVIVLKSLVSGQFVQWNRELDFKRLFWLSVLQGATRAGLLIVLALTLHNVWALVAAEVGAAAARMIGSFAMARRAPKLRFDWSELVRLTRYGKWVTAMAILTLVMNEGDDLFVTKVLGLETLAFYQFAFTVANLPTTHVTCGKQNASKANFRQQQAKRFQGKFPENFRQSLRESRGGSKGPVGFPRENS